jgi:hypothetical protein
MCELAAKTKRGRTPFSISLFYLDIFFFGAVLPTEFHSGNAANIHLFGMWWFPCRQLFLAAPCLSGR